MTDGDAAKTAKDILALRRHLPRRHRQPVRGGRPRRADGPGHSAAVFRPVHAGLSRLAAWLRLAYAAVFLVAIAQLADTRPVAHRGLRGVHPQPGRRNGTGQGRYVHRHLDGGPGAFRRTPALLGYLVYRSSQMPRLLGILLIVAGLRYAFDTMAAVLSAGSLPAVSTVTFLKKVPPRALAADPRPPAPPDHTPFDTRPDDCRHGMTTACAPRTAGLGRGCCHPLAGGSGPRPHRRTSRRSPHEPHAHRRPLMAAAVLTNALHPPSDPCSTTPMS